MFPYFQRIDDFIRELLFLSKSSIRKILIYVSDRTVDKTTIVINAICGQEMKISFEVENSLGKEVIDEFYNGLKCYIKQQIKIKIEVE